jgi:prepilin signal peptidase PulO-like enzyme (type II secretory pathway)
MLLPLVLVTAVAAGVAGQINRAIYSLAWNARPLSPWSPTPPGAPPRGWLDRIPVYGWWRLRREAARHGADFWVRPALIELGFIAGIALLYWFELGGGLLPIGAARPSDWALQLQFFRHACLIALMVVATFIDLDEKTIPDAITIPGTWLALLISAVWPASALPSWRTGRLPLSLEPLWLTQPSAWHPALDGAFGLQVALACILAWWYALLPKTLWYRGGLRKFVRLWLASMVRNPLTLWLTLMMLVAVGGTWYCWGRGGPMWQALLSAWVGMAIAGGVVWLVRIVGTMALQQEAMGFGDVTLMGMIGAFLGWQPGLLIFFLAPFTGVIVAVLRWLVTGHKDIAYGPFLCLAAVLVLVTWPAVWLAWGIPIFTLGWAVPIILLVSLLLLGVLLLAIQRLKRFIGV